MFQRTKADHFEIDNDKTELLVVDSWNILPLADTFSGIMWGVSRPPSVSTI
jgi:hypothetical protein